LETSSHFTAFHTKDAISLGKLSFTTPFQDRAQLSDLIWA